MARRWSGSAGCGWRSSCGGSRRSRSCRATTHGWRARWRRRMRLFDRGAYEHSDMRPRVILGAALGLLAALLLTLVLITIFEALLTGTTVTISRLADLIEGLRLSSAPTPAAPQLEAQSG